MSRRGAVVLIIEIRHNMRAIVGQHLNIEVRKLYKGNATSVWANGHDRIPESWWKKL